MNLKSEQETKIKHEPGYVCANLQAFVQICRTMVLINIFLNKYVINFIAPRFEVSFPKKADGRELVILNINCLYLSIHSVFKQVI